MCAEKGSAIHRDGDEAGRGDREALLPGGGEDTGGGRAAGDEAEDLGDGKGRGGTGFRGGANRKEQNRSNVPSAR